MSRPPRPAACLLAAIAWTPYGAFAYAVPLLHDAVLWERASSTCSSGFSPCVDTGLPSNFCCATNAICNPLAGNTTVICCPLGEDCSQINTITCDIRKQNVDLFPDAPIKTTALNGNLVKCGSSDACCPFGYSCNSDKAFCTRNANQNAVPLQNVPTTTSSTTSSTMSSTMSSSTKATPKASTTSTNIPLADVPTKSTTLLASATSATSAAPARTSGAAAADGVPASDTEKPSSGPSTASIAGGVVGGIVGVLLVSAVLWFFCARRRRRSGTPSSNGQPATGKPASLSSFGNIINNPLNISISSPKPQGDALLYRSDFIRKPPPSQDGPLPSAPVENSVVTRGVVGSVVSRDTNNVSSVSTSDAGSLSLSPRPLTLRQSQQQQQQQPAASVASRESAMEMEINVGVDPRMFLDGGSFTVSPTSPSATMPPNMMQLVASMPPGHEVPRFLETMPPPRRRRSADRLTTFSGLMRAANLDPERPYVPRGTPDPRQR